MSLKTFHIVFIIASILLTFGFAVWEVLHYRESGERIDLVFGILSLVAGIGLVFYGRYVFRKLKNISYL